MSRTVRTLMILLLSGSLITTALPAAALPPDRIAAQVSQTLAANPNVVEAWIDLAEAQRVMGYQERARTSLARAAELIKALPVEERRRLAGSYHTVMAWLEYDATNWQAAAEQASKAVRLAPGRESRLVQALAIAAMPEHGTPLREYASYLKPFADPGPDNRQRNLCWISLVREHHQSGPIDHWTYGNLFSVANEGKQPVAACWGELPCRRDYGYVYEANREWGLAVTSYERSAAACDDGLAAWATRLERRSPLQPASAAPLPFWTNAEGGYVTGSLLAYADHACERMMAAEADTERTLWASHLAFGATRALAVSIDPTWPWLWRALAWQTTGDAQAAARDLVQAEDVLADDARARPWLDFAHGHAELLKERFGPARTHLEAAVAAGLDAAPCWADLGLARAMNGDRSGARLAFDRALALTPQSAVALHNRGMLSLQEGDTPTALADLRRAAELAPYDEQVGRDVQKAELMARE